MSDPAPTPGHPGLNLILVATTDCPACGKKYAAHFDRCIHCAAPRPAGAAPEAERPAPIPVPASARREAPAAAVPPKPECPSCGGAPGPGKIRMETREYLGSSWTGRRRRYRVRWVDVPGACAPCMKRIEIKRYVADIVCILPFLVFFGALVASDSKVFLALILVYGLVLFRWSWGLGYVWADVLLYGRQLESSLARFEPPGDSGTVRFPAGWGHCILRLGWVPALVVVLGVVGSLLGKRPVAGTAGVPAPAASASADPVEQARAFLQSARDIAVPVDPATLSMERDPIGRQDMYFFTAYVKPALPPSGSSYLQVTGPELLAVFLRTPGHDVDLLSLRGGNTVTVARWQAARIASTLPASGPPPSKVLRRP